MLLDGEIVEIDPPRRLVTTFSATWSPEVAADPPSQLTWEIEPIGGACRLRMIHEELAPGSATVHEVAGGWSHILSSLKDAAGDRRAAGGSPRPEQEEVAAEGFGLPQAEHPMGRVNGCQLGRPLPAPCVAVRR